MKTDHAGLDDGKLKAEAQQREECRHHRLGPVYEVENQKKNWTYGQQQIN